MTLHHPQPSWHPTPNLAALAAAAADAALELADRLLPVRAATAAPDHGVDDGEQVPTVDLATAWEVAATLRPVTGQLAKTFQLLGGAVAGTGRGDEQLAILAARLAEAAEQLDAADDLLAVLQDEDVADRVDQLAGPRGADGDEDEDEDEDEAADAADDLSCPATDGFHRVDWPTIRLPRGEHSVLVNCGACGQAGEVNSIDEDQIDWPADLADLAG